MQNIDFLYNSNKSFCKLNHLDKNILNYRSNIKIFDFRELKKIISFFYTGEEKFKKANILYNIIYKNKLEFVDKLTYILFECLLYDLIINKHKKLNIKLEYKTTIKTEGLTYSCINVYNDGEKFKKSFYSDIFKTHFRKLISYNEYLDNPKYLSLIMSDIRLFLTNYDIDLEQANKMSEISVELIDNALEHSKSDCLIDIDFSLMPYTKKDDNDPKTEYFTANIALLSFSETEIGDKIKEMCLDKTIVAQQYEKLNHIYNVHKQYFDDSYSDKHFFTLSAFQDKITSRSGKLSTGGKGLTKLIKGLEDASEAYICYMTSGDITLFFHKNLIKQDKDRWVGFNVENNIKAKPDKESFAKSPICVKGTVYNLTFILKRSISNEKN